jgi:tRNA(fMet)-specific endonuclease VapC
MFVDSSFLIGLGRGSEAAVQFYEQHSFEEFSASTVVGFELFGGLLDQGHGDAMEELRRDLDWVDFVDFSMDDALEAAQLEAELEADGRRIRIPDMMIAAVARQRGETLVAADGHFEQVDGLDYVNFREIDG